MTMRVFGVSALILTTAIGLVARTFALDPFGVLPREIELRALPKPLPLRTAHFTHNYFTHNYSRDINRCGASFAHTTDPSAITLSLSIGSPV
jgi:purine nucleoside phosphorylase